MLPDEHSPSGQLVSRQQHAHVLRDCVSQEPITVLCHERHGGDNCRHPRLFRRAESGDQVLGEAYHSIYLLAIRQRADKREELLSHVLACGYLQLED